MKKDLVSSFFRKFESTKDRGFCRERMQWCLLNFHAAIPSLGALDYETTSFLRDGFRNGLEAYTGIGGEAAITEKLVDEILKNSTFKFQKFLEEIDDVVYRAESSCHKS